MHFLLRLFLVSLFILGWGGYPIIGDRIIAAINSYDQQIYAIGKGPTSTTVEAPLAGVSLDQTLVIRSAVNDVSLGTTREEIKLRFPNGLPAVADSNMTAWMRYVYQQLPKPKNIQGVVVAINVIDANGDYRTIGTTTSDKNGFFSLAWQPDISGKYTLIATFAGTDAYYGSSAQTAFFADESHPTTPYPKMLQLQLLNNTSGQK